MESLIGLKRFRHVPNMHVTLQTLTMFGMLRSAKLGGGGYFELCALLEAPLLCLCLRLILGESMCVAESLGWNPCASAQVLLA